MPRTFLGFLAHVLSVALFCVGIFCLTAAPPVGQSHAQVPMTGAGLGAPSSGGFTPSCTQSGTFLTAATTVTLPLDKTNYDQLICGLVSDGVWNFDVLYIWAAPNTTAALINLAQPAHFPGTVNGTPSFSAYNGYTGDGLSFYIDTGLNTKSATSTNCSGSPCYVLNSAGAGIYVLSNFTSGGASFATLDTDENANLRIVPNFFGNASWQVNDTTAISTTSSTSRGQWIGTRTAVSTLALYLNSNETPFGSASTTSIDLPNANVFFFASNNVGSPGNFTTAQMSAGFVGKGLTATDMCKIGNRINTYMTNLAAPINIYSNGVC